MGTNGCSGIKFTNNTVRYNSATGVVYNDGTRTVTHSGNLSYGNYTRLGTKTRTPFTLTGWASKIERDILRKSSYTRDHRHQQVPVIGLSARRRTGFSEAAPGAPLFC